MTIYKYAISIHCVQSVFMPKGAEILSVANQNEALCLWAMVHPDEPMEERRIEIVGTGREMPIGMGVERKFIGTVVIDPFVWHVFERLL